MADYRIICTRQEPCYVNNLQAHIVVVGTGVTPQTYTQLWSLDDVLAAMRFNRFYTQSPSTGAIAWVQPFTCAYCRRIYIRSTADAVQDNNLDYLPTCG